MHMTKFNLLIAISMFFAFAGCNLKELPVVRDQVRKMDEIATAETDKAIENSPELQELDSICTHIPLNDSFRLYGKRIAPNYPSTLFYSYDSSEDFETASRRFTEHFAGLGWASRQLNAVNRITEFRSEKFRVTIQYGGIGKNANYSFSCEKISDAR
jgi:hypothetical protein